LSASFFEKAKSFGLLSDVYFQFAVFSSHSVYIEPLPAASFNLRAGQACSHIGLSPASIMNFNTLADVMIKEMVEAKLGIDTLAARELVSAIAIKWAEFIKYNRENAITNDMELASEECLVAYVNSIFPYAGMINFPFFKEIEKCNSCFQITNSQKHKTKSRFKRVLRKLFIESNNHVYSHLGFF